AKLREEMRDEIKELTRSLGVTTLHVTHDQTEAMALADLMAVMHEGKILEIGQPEALYRNPGTRSVAEFLGRTNWLTGVVEGNGTVTTGVGLVKCPLPNGAGRGSRVSLGIRPEWVELTAEPCRSTNSFAGTIDGRMFLGDAVLYWVRVGQSRMLVKTTVTEFSIGSQVNVIAPADHWVVFSETA
ncbi:MAG: ABC transporter ATP-binding protein, partial [Deltaproteobacteria bacterium]|nr:ABC transporter ATP-binding protein [Deltaproteobacteria bacterium]